MCGRYHGRMNTQSLLLSLPLLAALCLSACSDDRAAPAAETEPAETGPAVAAETDAAAAGSATDADNCGLRIDDAWARMAPGQMPMHGGFMSVQNSCAEPIAIVGADSDFYGHVELHETVVEDGVSRMREVPSLPVPGLGRIELAPGGLHLMLMQPVAGLMAGQSVEIGFELDNGERIEAGFELRAPGN